jgi:aminoglycoside phosphotransferase (APT) family kinase protein
VPLGIEIDELGAALGSAVRGCRASLIGRFSCELWHLDVQTEDGRRQQLALKRPLQMPGRNSLALERHFYQRCGTQLAVVPRYFGSLPRIDAILLEYLADLVPFDWQRGPDDTHLAAAIAALVQLHRLPLANADWLPRFDTARIAAMQRDYTQAWHMRRVALSGLYPPFARLGDWLANNLVMSLAPLATCSVLLHGDAHAENLAVRTSGSVAMLDWQDPALGNPGSDLADLIVMSHPVTRRREIEAAMIDRHAEQFGRTGYDRQAGYRAGVLHRVARIVRIAGHHPNWSSLPWLFERCAAAAVDVTTREAE